MVGQSSKRREETPLISNFSFSICLATFQEYAKISSHTIEKAIEREFSGDIKEGLLAIVEAMKNKHRYFAMRLYYSMKGLGTNDRYDFRKGYLSNNPCFFSSILKRIVSSRCEIDMGEIKVSSVFFFCFVLFCFLS